MQHFKHENVIWSMYWFIWIPSALKEEINTAPVSAHFNDRRSRAERVATVWVGNDWTVDDGSGIPNSFRLVKAAAAEKCAAHAWPELVPLNYFFSPPTDKFPIEFLINVILLEIVHPDPG